MRLLVLPLFLAVLFVALSMAAAWGVRRRRLPESLDPMQEPLGGVFMSGIAGLFGVLVAFVLTAALGRLEDARSIVAAEINDLAVLTYLAEGFPPGARKEIRAHCESYFETLSTGDPRETRGADLAALHLLLREIGRFKPEDSAQSNVHAVAIERIAQLGEHRRARLILGQQSLPWPVWGLLIFGGLFAMFLTTYARIDPPRLHLGFVAGLSTLIAASLLAIYVIERPFGVGFPAWYAKYESILQAGREAMRSPESPPR